MTYDDKELTDAEFEALFERLDREDAAMEQAMSEQEGRIVDLNVVKRRAAEILAAS